MSCVFCDIVNKKIPAFVVAENKNAIAFLDINPIADGHTVVISKKHYANLRECPDEVLSDMIKLSKEVANKISESKLKPWGFNYLSNDQKIAGQEIMHIHFHVIPKYGKHEGFKFGIGTHYVDEVKKVYELLNKK